MSLESPHIKNLKESATLAINELCNSMQLSGKQVFKLGLGQSPFPVPERIVEELRKHADKKDYLPVAGLTELRSAIADHYKNKKNLSVDAERVLIGPGSKELLFLLQLIYQSTVILPTPCWVSYGPQANLARRPVKTINTTFENGWMMQPEQLEKLCSSFSAEEPKLLILNYPGNPTSTSYPSSLLKDIAKVCKQNNIIVLCDEIYADLSYLNKYTSMAKFYPEGTIISSGISKWAGAGGWRLGYMIFPRQLELLFESMCATASETYTSVCAPVQFAAIKAMQGSSDIQKYLKASRFILKQLGERCSSILRNAGIKLYDPTAGFYLWIDFSDIDHCRKRFKTSKSLCESLLSETGVAILPGVEFMRSSEELTARLALVDFDGAKALCSVGDLTLSDVDEPRTIETFCPRVIRAVEIIANWSNGNPY